MDEGESLAYDFTNRRASRMPRRASDIHALERLEDATPLGAINVNSNTFGREHRLTRKLRDRILSELCGDGDVADFDLAALDRSIRAFVDKNALQRLDDTEAAWKKITGEMSKLQFVLQDLSQHEIVRELSCHEWSSSRVLLEIVHDRLDDGTLDSLSPAEACAFAAKVKGHFKKCSRSGLAGSELLDAVVLACEAELLPHGSKP